MRKWFTENVEIKECEYDYSLHAFEIYRLSDKRYLGDIIPLDMSDYLDLCEALDEGECPITDRWEDGQGNTCDLNGWKE